jgi:hypothetical protein
MHTTDWLQLGLFIGLLAVLTKPTGIYLTRVLDADGKTWLDPFLRPLEKFTYRLMGVDTTHEHDWKSYSFSIANDVAKYFAIIPAMLMVTFPAMAALNVMRLASPQSAILSAIIFNALVIIALIPLAFRGVAYKPLGAVAVLRRNLLIYGLGGLIIPFVGIKAIDLVISTLNLA